MSNNKIAVVTGANAGLGFQTALGLARSGVCVVMACRNMDKARKAQGDLLAQVPNAITTLIQLDISEPASIREFAHQFAQQLGELDLLINNAGVVAMPLTRNSVGQEMQFATNYLGAFALTGTLLPLFREQTPTRIVNVGSLAHRLGKIDLDDLNWEKTPYDKWKGYANSKVAMLSMTMELDRRLRARGSSTMALAAHPGFASTDVGKGNAALTPKSAFGRWFNEKAEKLIPRAADAAKPILYAACANGVSGGEYYGPSGFLEISGKVGKARLNSIAQDSGIGQRLWTLSEAMTGVSYLSDV